MTTVTLEEARANLPELFRRVAVGEEFIVMDQGKCIGRLSPPPEDLEDFEEQFTISPTNAKEAVRAIFCQLKDRQPVLQDGTKVQDYLDPLEQP